MSSLFDVGKGENGRGGELDGLFGGFPATLTIISRLLASRFSLSFSLLFFLSLSVWMCGWQ